MSRTGVSITDEERVRRFEQRLEVERLRCGDPSCRECSHRMKDYDYRVLLRDYGLLEGART